jgi:hypothetical protein
MSKSVIYICIISSFAACGEEGDDTVLREDEDVDAPSAAAEIAAKDSSEDRGDDEPADGRPQSIATDTREAADGIPVYGNFCGPGYGDQSLDAVDAVDQQCKIHDACFDSKGYFDCGCDRALLENMHQALLTPGLSEEALAAGAGVISYFAQAQCVCMEEVCVDYPKCDWSGCEWDTICNDVLYGVGYGGIGPC